MTDQEATPETLRALVHRMGLPWDVINGANLAADVWEEDRADRIAANRQLQHADNRIGTLTQDNDALRSRIEALEKELAAVLDVAIARGEELGFVYADDDYRERLAALKESP